MANYRRLTLDGDCIRMPLRWVGGGGFCDMFRGTHVTGVDLALKRPRISADDPQEAENVLRRFRREGKIWEALTHPNILQFIGTMNISGETYLISPWLEHGDLSKFVSARLRFLGLSEDVRHLHPSRAAFERFNEWYITHGIISGLAYLHKQNVIHGDIKAANVLLDAEMRPMLCDFGMTKVLDGTHNITSTAMKGAGSFRWMSPELLSTNTPKSLKSDIFAFGMTIVEVITGNVPFPDIPNANAIVAIISGQRPAFQQIFQISFRNLWILASACWDHEPARRPSARDILAIMAKSTGTSLFEYQALGTDAYVASTEQAASRRASSSGSYVTAPSSLANDQEPSPTDVQDDRVYPPAATRGAPLRRLTMPLTPQPPLSPFSTLGHGTRRHSESQQEAKSNAYDHHPYD
ncbi:hypothetical protein FRB93_011886 [Tulasnella sp. JGI-2019a]|nr:hypothetical protein FRB93_011886 [Tulasnella sp. JGI-2019a]